MALYIVIEGDEDGNPIRLYDENGIEEFLYQLGEERESVRFEDEDFLIEKPDPNYWPDDVIVIVKADVLVPKPAGAYVLP